MADSSFIVSKKLAVALALIAAFLTTGVGLGVYYGTGSKDTDCKCGNDGAATSGTSKASRGSLVPADITDECKQIVMAGNRSSEICSTCPYSNSTSNTSSTGPGGSSSSRKPTATMPPMPLSTQPPDIFPPMSIRLPQSVVPVHYDLRLQPFMYTTDPKDFTFEGEVSIKIKCLENTDSINLHSKKLKLDESTVKVVDSNGEELYIFIEEDRERDFLIITMDESELKQNQEYVLSMSYSARLKKKLTGLYLSEYTRDGQPVYIVASQFEPTDARSAFPCFDEPAMKATFNITLVRKKELISIFNTPILETSAPWTENGVTFVADRYAQTPKMSTYLLAFVICDFVNKTGVDSNNVTYRVFARPEVINATTYALDAGLKILPFYEEFFGNKYPLPKQDMIAIPDFEAGAMENWGLITYRDSYLLYTAGSSSEADKETVATSVAHELAHMWFGDLVTMSWWDDLWLNEGFATFVEYMGADVIGPQFKMWEKFVSQALHGSMGVDGIVTSHPLIVSVENPDEINEIFDDISYSKGGSLIRMMQHFLGDETFRLGLVQYLHSHKYGNAVHDGLWNALEQQATRDGKNVKVKNTMDTWTLQMNYPVVTVTRDANNPHIIKVEQNRFLLDPTAKDPGTYTSPFGYMWSIPLTFTNGNNPNFKQNDTGVHWIYKDEKNKNFTMQDTSYSDADSWILANIDQKGFYRVNYDESNWKALVKQLNTDHEVIGTINRAQIINDAFSLSKPGLLNITVALETTNYLDKELSYVPWSAADTELSYLSSMLSLTSAYGNFKKFTRSKIEGPYNYYASHNPSNQDTAVIFNRQLACTYGIKSCIDDAMKEFQKYMESNGTYKVDANMKSSIYCQGVEQGGQDAWDFAFKMFQASTEPSETVSLMTALTCTKEPWILNHFLKLTLEDNSPIRQQDVFEVITNIASSTTGNFLAWPFYRDNFDTLTERYSSSLGWGDVILELTRDFNTEFRFSEVKELKERNRNNLGTSKRAFDQALEKIRSNIKWMDANYQAVAQWLTDQTAHL